MLENAIAIYEMCLNRMQIIIIYFTNVLIIKFCVNLANQSKKINFNCISFKSKQVWLDSDTFASAMRCCPVFYYFLDTCISKTQNSPSYKSMVHKKVKKNLTK